MLSIIVFVFTNNLKQSYKQFLCIIEVITAKIVKFRKMQL